MLEDLARVLQQIAVQQIVGGVESEDPVADAELAELATLLAAEDIQLFYQIALLGRRDLHLAPDPRSGAEMTLLRMLAFRPAAAVRGSGGAAPARQESATAPLATPGTKVMRAKPPRAAEPRAAEWAEPDWGALSGELGLPGAVRLLAANCAYLRRTDNTIFLSIDPRSESLLTRSRKDALAAALTLHFGEQLDARHCHRRGVRRNAGAKGRAPHARENGSGTQRAGVGPERAGAERPVWC